MSEAIRHIEDYDSGTRHRATVVSSTRITPAAAPEVREIVIDVEAAEDYRVGQCLGVVAPGSPAFGHDEHFRLYSVADLPVQGSGGRPRIALCVRRCSYVDEYSGEEFPGIASNFLCDLAPGDTLRVTGPVGIPFAVPEEHDANLVLIGSGTGIAPFRGLVKHIFRDVPDWTGRIWLFHGARSGLELLYMNEEVDDFAQYYDRETFEAFRALSPRPSWDDPIAWDRVLEQRGEKLWEMLGSPKTWVYVAGLERTLGDLDEVFARIAGSPERWARRKAELAAGGRLVELVY